MLTLYGDLDSGNAHKGVAQLGIAYRAQSQEQGGTWSVLRCVLYPMPQSYRCPCAATSRRTQ